MGTLVGLIEAAVGGPISPATTAATIWRGSGLQVAADCNIDRVEARAGRDRHTEKVFQPLP